MSKKKTNKKTNKKNNTSGEVANKLSAKKVVYVILTIILGKLLGFLVFEAISINFVSMLEKDGLPVQYDQIFGLVYSPLPAYLFWTLIVTGAVGGFFLGLSWWRMVYVEHKHWRNRMK